MMEILSKIKDTVSQFMVGYGNGESASITKQHSFVIDRREWARGEGLSGIFLLRGGDKKRDCLGFYFQSLGLPDEEMLNVGHPTFLSLEARKKLSSSWLYEDQERVRPFEPVTSEDASSLIRYNDRRVGEPSCSFDNDTTPMTDAYREKMIRKIFGKHHVTVKFIN